LIARTFTSRCRAKAMRDFHYGRMAVGYERELGRVPAAA
jgi:hypothetical protein